MVMEKGECGRGWSKTGGRQVNLMERFSAFLRPKNNQSRKELCRAQREVGMNGSLKETQGSSTLSAGKPKILQCKEGHKAKCF